MLLQFRTATMEDFDAVVQITRDGRQALANLGIDQWQGGNPTPETIREDILAGWTRVAVDGADGTVLGCLALCDTGEPDYDRITDGAWLTNSPNDPDKGKATYLVAHRFAVSAKATRKGVASFMFHSCVAEGIERGFVSVRVDTHPGNTPMQKVMTKAGFTRCCEIDITCPTELSKLRVGYERCLPSEAHPFGRTLVIGNPVSRNGNGAMSTAEVRGELAKLDACTHMDVVISASAENVETLASSSGPYDTLVVVGGDGTIHHAVNGLMSVPNPARPVLAVIPLGSGNDFARTLDIPLIDIPAAVEHLVKCPIRPIDLGQVNGEFFTQTVSFGLDAEIALESSKRQRTNKRTGLALYGATAVDVFSKKHRKAHRFDARLTTAAGEVQSFSGEEIVFAVQNGPTYGSGFRIAPDAVPSDGELDLVRTVIVPSFLHTMGVLLLARFGKHTGSKAMEFRKLTDLHIEFAEQPPVQVDGEPLQGRVFNISCVPQAIKVFSTAV